MLFLGHVGPSLFAAHSMNRGKPLTGRTILLLLFWTVLPDAVDKFLFKAGLAPAPTGRLWAHTALAAVGVCLFCRIWFRSSWPLVLAFPGHLLLDAMWQRPHTLFWPFLGLAFDPGWPVLPDDVVTQGFLAVQEWNWHHHPQFIFSVWTAELAGLVLTGAALRRRFSAGGRNAKPGIEAAIPEKRSVRLSSSSPQT